MYFSNSCLPSIWNFGSREPIYGCQRSIARAICFSEASYGRTLDNTLAIGHQRTLTYLRCLLHTVALRFPSAVQLWAIIRSCSVIRYDVIRKVRRNALSKTDVEWHQVWTMRYHPSSIIRKYPTVSSSMAKFWKKKEKKFYSSISKHFFSCQPASCSVQAQRKSYSCVVERERELRKVSTCVWKAWHLSHLKRVHTSQPNFLFVRKRLWLVPDDQLQLINSLKLTSYRLDLT